MVSILLTVLKIIGIVILIILGLIVFILLLILLVPVQYRGRGSYQDSLFAAELGASWLLHMISVRGTYQNKQKFHICMKLFGIRIYDNFRGNSQKSRHKKTKLTKNNTKGTNEIQAASSEETIAEDISFDKDNRHTVSDHPGNDSDNNASENIKTNVYKEKKLGIIQKIKTFFINFVEFFKNIKFTFQKVYDTIIRIKNDVEYYLKVLQLDSTKRAFTVCQKQLGRVLKKISPRKYQVNLHLGFDDPAVMGEVLAVWGMFYPFHQGNIDIQPEFEQAVLEGNFSFRGRVSVFVFARAVCILLFDKDIKRLLKQLRRSEN